MQKTQYLKSIFCLCYLSLTISLYAQEPQNNFSTTNSSVRHRKLSEPAQQETIQDVPDTYIKIINEKSYTRNDSLFIYFQALIKGNIVKSGESLSLIPEYQRGDDAYEFPAILINGKQRTPYYKRERALATPESYWQYKPYVTVVAKKRQQHQIDYSYALPLPGGTQQGKLVLKYLKQDCCDIAVEKTDSLELVDKGNTRIKKELRFLAVGYPEYKDKVTYIEPSKEVEKLRRDTIVIRINYPVDRAKVLPYFAENAKELNRIDSLFRYFYKTEDTYHLLNIDITGYASPEATYQHNLKLSERRAKGFYDYFLKEYSALKLPFINVLGFGEDWKGLEKAVEATEMKHKQRVLHIIEHIGVFQGREKKLMDIAGGVPYRYMLKTLFPPLRRIELCLEYKVRSFSADEAKGLWKERPQDLSQQELYEVASQTKDSKPLEIAANYFPDDVTANINASSAALIEGDLQRAYSYLQKVWQEPKALNNIGVYYMLQKDYKQARVFFEKALLVDKQKASANLKLIEEVEKRTNR